MLVFCALAFLYLPTRLAEGAVPEWRPIQWLLAAEVVGLSLCAVYMLKGGGWASHLAFPLCFFFVAVPWPSIVETPIIQKLTRLDGAMVVEVLGLFGIPIVQRGNLLEVANGVVGIDEACSGIRSFQSSLMISLFFGELYRLVTLQRVLLVGIGFFLSFAFNVCRTSLLTWVAAKKGLSAIDRYHDSAGVTILVVCTASIWGVALFLAKRKVRAISQTTTDTRPTILSAQNGALDQGTTWVIGHSVLSFALLLVAWLALVEIVVPLYYRKREAQITSGPFWRLEFPTNNPTFRPVPIDSKTEQLLRCDEGKGGIWKDAQGNSWQGFYFDWLPGRTAGYLAKRHTPDICLPASGYTLRGSPELRFMTAAGLELPVRCYQFTAPGGGIVYVFHCRWEAGAARESYVEKESDRLNLLRAIWAGRGRQGQKILEFIVFGIDQPDQARQAFAEYLNNLIHVNNNKSG